MTPVASRRRFLFISAAAAATAALPGPASAVTRWTGRAMGAETSLVLAGVDQQDAALVWQEVELELARLKAIFSLYQPQSEIVRLNTSGWLTAPSPELLEVLSLCDTLHRATEGAFDPSLQPLWRAHARAAERGKPVSDRDLDAATALTGWQNVSFDAGEIRLQRHGMALTLNGIAQGYITDRIASLLRSRGLRDVLIDMGEISALGRHPDGRAWTAGIATPDGRVTGRVQLEDRALATSAPGGTILNPVTGTGHIFDPRARRQQPLHQLVSVSGPSAALCDGLSTAGCLMEKKFLERAVSAFSGVTIEAMI